jgi:acyl-coenzyme A thioesterase PaaI-like protein
MRTRPWRKPASTGAIEPAKSKIQVASRSKLALRSVLVTTKQEIDAFLAAQFPQAKSTIQDVGNHAATVSRDIGTADLRPGGTVSGPVLMAVADLALYVAILGEIGIVPLAVTTSMTINFLRKPAAAKRVIGVCKLLKMGKSLAVGEVSVYSEGIDEPVAHVVGTYSIPPAR